MHCTSTKTIVEKIWPYYEYYLGEKDDKNRKNGKGEYYWSGPESLEGYKGRIFRDTMHGLGDYRWRHWGPSNVQLTYEGHFFANHMHGYGTMSYQDGKVFNGLYYKNVRWGPGVETFADLHQNVGLWRGNQLVRLAWRPSSPSVAIDLITTQAGRAFSEHHRKLLATVNKKIGETNNALELLKQNGLDPKLAAEKWEKLYPEHCTDMPSELCHLEAFQRDYYSDKISYLKQVDKVPENNEIDETTDDGMENEEKDTEQSNIYYSWNNSCMMMHMMQHCFQHEAQRERHGVDLHTLLTGPRKRFMSPGQHESDCRSLLMACFLGHTKIVIQLVNEHNVHPDISDVLGNTALMYAVCGNHPKIIQFLIEAGAAVDSYNDSCCTPLGVALMRYACVQRDIAPSAMLQAVLQPAPPVPITQPQVSEWHISREHQTVSLIGTLDKSHSKITRSHSAKKIKSLTSVREISALLKNKRKSDSAKLDKRENDSVMSFHDDTGIFYVVNQEYSNRVNELFSIPNKINPIPYLFEVNDVVKAINCLQNDEKKASDKAPKKVTSKVIKAATKTSNVDFVPEIKEDSMTSIEKDKIELLDKIMSTILQLLSDGADPDLTRCPLPALLMATTSQSKDLVRNLLQCGLNVNEVFPQVLCYTALDVAISQPFNNINLELIREILENGACPNRQFSLEDPTLIDTEGPTLLHVVLLREVQDPNEEEVKKQILQLLLQFRSDPSKQFRGSSAVELAMSKMEWLNLFINSSTTNLNAPINESHQTILSKIFDWSYFGTVTNDDRFETLTNLLLFGADPLLECRHSEENFGNLFVLANQTLDNLNTSHVQTADNHLSDNYYFSPNLEDFMDSSSDIVMNADAKVKTKKKEDLTKSSGKLTEDLVVEYKESLDLVKECTRMLHIRWLQAQLFKELLKIISKFHHRPWNMILKECKNRQRLGLWLSPSRCLEIWNILKPTKRYDKRLLKNLLCVTQYLHYNTESLRTKINAQEKRSVDQEVNKLLGELCLHASIEIDSLRRPYVKLELNHKRDRKFEVCFECCLPLREDRIQCKQCKIIYFCNLECMAINVNRLNCHPCSEYLKQKYFPTLDESL